MATARARALSLGVLLLALALCLTACAAGERQPKDRYISYAGLPRSSAGNGCHFVGSAIFGRKKSCPGKPPSMGVSKTAAAESKGAYISHAAAAAPSADKYPSPTMTGPKTAGKEYPAPTMTGATTAAAGPEGAYIGPSALSEEKTRYISYAALKHDQPQGKKCPRGARSTCP